MLAAYGHFLAATSVPDCAPDVGGAEQKTLFPSSDIAKRRVSKRCVPRLLWKHRELDRTSVLAGAFDLKSSLGAGKHIFAADQGDYYKNLDGSIACCAFIHIARRRRPGCGGPGADILISPERVGRPASSPARFRPSRLKSASCSPRAGRGAWSPRQSRHAAATG
jgi:hypothetical protein